MGRIPMNDIDRVWEDEDFRAGETTMTQHTPGHLRKCRGCAVEFCATESQIRKSDFQCRLCRRAYAKQWRKSRKKTEKPVVSTKMPRAYHQAYEKQYRERPGVRQKMAENQRKYRQDAKLRPRHEARWLTNRAVKSGKLVRQPCEVCGVEPAEAHHDDYSKPLDVRWLCKSHHAAIHSNKGE